MSRDEDGAELMVKDVEERSKSKVVQVGGPEEG